MPDAKREECLIGVFWTALNDPDDKGRGHNHFRGMTTADLALDQAPRPGFTNEEMQCICRAAKFEAQKCLILRKKARQKKPGRASS